MRQVTHGTPIGLLGYAGARPVAWCSIAPRTTCRDLGCPGNLADDPKGVWSLVCFFVKRPFRGQGVTGQLLEAAVATARRRSAKIVEAYPVDRASPSYRFMGIVEVFERAGFKKVGTVGTRRHVVRLMLR